MIRQLVQHVPMGHTTPIALVGQSAVIVSNSNSRRLHNSSGALPVRRLSSKANVTVDDKSITGENMRRFKKTSKRGISLPNSVMLPRCAGTLPENLLPLSKSVCIAVRLPRTGGMGPSRSLSFSAKYSVAKYMKYKELGQETGARCSVFVAIASQSQATYQVSINRR